MTALGLVLILGLLIFGVEGVFAVAEEPSRFALANGLAFATAIPYALLLLWIDRNEQEPIALVVVALLWGAVVATLLSGMVNVGFREVVQDEVVIPGVARTLSSTISAPFIEELTKGAAVMFIFLLFRDEFDNLLDGILYGALVGLGFATVENVGYYMEVGETGGLKAMLQLAWLRGVLNGLAGHATYTALIGCGFALVRTARTGWARWLYVPLYWFLAMLLHYLWNRFAGDFVLTSDPALTYTLWYPAASLVLHLPFTALLVVTVALVWRQEQQVILTYLVGEDEDIVTAEERRALVPARRRLREGLLRLFSEGPVSWWHHRRLEYELIELAFARWHLDEDPRVDWTADQDEDIHRLRERVRRRRARLAVSPGSA